MFNKLKHLKQLTCNRLLSNVMQLPFCTVRVRILRIWISIDVAFVVDSVCRRSRFSNRVGTLLIIIREVNLARSKQVW